MIQRRAKALWPLLVALTLGLLGTAGNVQAQGASSAVVSTDSSSQSVSALRSSPASSSTQSASSLNPYRSLENYVHRRDTRLPAGSQLDGPTRRGVSLDRGGKLLWGTVGLVMSDLCESRTKRTGFIESPSAWALDHSGCENCERIGERSFENILEGVFGSRP